MKKNLAYIVLRGDSKEVFLSYGFDLHKSKVLYAASKKKIPDAFISTSFNKHSNEMLDEMRDKEDRSTLLFFLPSITDRKEKINQWREHVNLTPIDFSIEFIGSFSKKKAKFNPLLLNSNGDERLDQVDMLYGLFNHIAAVSNQNLIRKVDYLNVYDKRDSESMEWSVGGTKKRFDSSKFKLTY